MYVHNQRANEADVQELRRAGGRWLKALRTARGLSQRQMAREVGAEYYTFISQLENGRGRIPPDRYRAWARSLGLAPSTFVFNLMRFYDPVTFELLFDEDGKFGGDTSRFRRIDAAVEDTPAKATGAEGAEQA
ncbi:MAG: helix-turn-helix transcriptional regulator [Pseudomonadota bacterium]